MWHSGNYHMHWDLRTISIFFYSFHVAYVYLCALRSFVPLFYHPSIKLIFNKLSDSDKYIFMVTHIQQIKLFFAFIFVSVSSFQFYFIFVSARAARCILITKNAANKIPSESKIPELIRTVINDTTYTHTHKRNSKPIRNEY